MFCSVAAGALATCDISLEVRGIPFAPYERVLTPGAKPVEDLEELDDEPDPGNELVVEFDSEPDIAPSKLTDGGCT